MNMDTGIYNSSDISKYGTHKYTEAEDFGILTIAYPVDGGATSVIDMIKVDNEPSHADFEMFKIALSDPAVKKYIFNANFERTYLAKHFNKRMPPEK